MQDRNGHFVHAHHDSVLVRNAARELMRAGVLRIYTAAHAPMIVMTAPAYAPGDVGEWESVLNAQVTELQAADHTNTELAHKLQAATSNYEKVLREFETLLLACKHVNPAKHAIPCADAATPHDDDESTTTHASPRAEAATLHNEAESPTTHGDLPVLSPAPANDKTDAGDEDDEDASEWQEFSYADTVSLDAEAPKIQHILDMGGEIVRQTKVRQELEDEIRSLLLMRNMTDTVTGEVNGVTVLDTTEQQFMFELLAHRKHLREQIGVLKQEQIMLTEGNINRQRETQEGEDTLRVLRHLHATTVQQESSAAEDGLREIREHNAAAVLKENSEAETNLRDLREKNAMLVLNETSATENILRELREQNAITVLGETKATESSLQEIREQNAVSAHRMAAEHQAEHDALLLSTQRETANATQQLKEQHAANSTAQQEYAAQAQAAAEREVAAQTMLEMVQTEAAQLHVLLTSETERHSELCAASCTVEAATADAEAQAVRVAREFADSVEALTAVKLEIRNLGGTKQYLHEHVRRLESVMETIRGKYSDFTKYTMAQHQCEIEEHESIVDWDGDESTKRPARCGDCKASTAYVFQMISLVEQMLEDLDKKLSDKAKLMEELLTNSNVDTFIHP